MVEITRTFSLALLHLGRNLKVKLPLVSLSQDLSNNPNKDRDQPLSQTWQAMF
jgi:hypothetical protein